MKLTKERIERIAQVHGRDIYEYNSMEELKEKFKDRLEEGAMILFNEIDDETLHYYIELFWTGFHKIGNEYYFDIMRRDDYSEEEKRNFYTDEEFKLIDKLFGGKYYEGAN